MRPAYFLPFARRKICLLSFAARCGLTRYSANHWSAAAIIHPRPAPDRTPQPAPHFLRRAHTLERLRSLRPALEVPRPLRPAGKCQVVLQATEKQKCPAPRTPARCLRRIPRRSQRPANPIVSPTLAGALDKVHLPQATIAFRGSPRVPRASHATQIPVLFPAANNRRSQATFHCRRYPSVVAPVREFLAY